MKTAAQRRSLFATLIAATTLGMAGVVGFRLAADGLTWGEGVLVGFYGILLAWISAGFWLFAIGACAGIRSTRPPVALGPAARKIPLTAIVIPVYHEDVAAVFDRVRVIYRSLERAGRLRQFEFFVLSDSRDDEAGRAEVEAWRAACLELGAAGRLFYRRRQDNLGRKSGNIEEFCRRWGGRYTYMVVLDADSLMGGRTLAALVERMEADPGLGLLQTWPVSIGGQSLFARLQQFAGSLYGRLFIAGLSWVQMGAGTYWGHNAIIRMRAFTECCALPPLPGRKPLGGHILSHDFVEAALLVRAGWRVRLAPDLPDSYEEGVPNLIEHARRDRRWCQGNLQHGRLLFARGLHPMSRMTLLIGIMSYLSGPLWLAFVALSILTFPGDIGHWIWPRQSVDRLPGLIVVTATLVLLIGPKMLGLGFALVDRRTRREHGGSGAIVLGVMIETMLSALLAPLLAVLHARFVLSVLSGHDSGWGPPQRGAAEVGWRTAFDSHGAEMAVGLALAALSATVAPDLFWWLLPISVPLVLAVPITVLSGRTAWGRAMRRRGLLLTPAEVRPTREVRDLAALEAARQTPRPTGASGFTPGTPLLPARKDPFPAGPPP